jgi:hypothetical protein
MGVHLVEELRVAARAVDAMGGEALRCFTACSAWLFARGTTWLYSARAWLISFSRSCWDCSLR